MEYYRLLMTALLIFLPKILLALQKHNSLKIVFGLNTHDLVSFSSRSIYKSIGWSLVRYIIYTIQYALVIMAFNGWSGIETLFSGIALIYFVQTIIPLPSLVNVVARGEIAILFWPKAWIVGACCSFIQLHNLVDQFNLSCIDWCNLSIQLFNI